MKDDTVASTNPTPQADDRRMEDRTGIHIRSVAGILAIGLLVMLILTSGAVFFVNIPMNNQTIVGQLIGTELSLLGVCVTYYFGSSANARMAQQSLADLSQSNLAAQTTLSAVNVAGTGKDSMNLKAGEIAVAVGTQGGGAQITKSPEVLDKVLENLDPKAEKIVIP